MDLFEIAKEGDWVAWTKALSSGLDPYELDGYGVTPLDWSVKMGHLDFFQKAISTGIDPFFPHRPSGNVVFQLIDKNQTKFLQLLEEYYSLWKDSPHLQTKDKDGNTVYHRLASFSFPSLDEKLAEDMPWEYFSIKNLEGRTPLEEAVYEGNLALVEIFVKRGKDQKDSVIWFSQLVFLAASLNHLEILLFLWKVLEPDWDAKDKSKQTALALAAENDATEVMEFLLQQGADPFVTLESGEAIPTYLEREKFHHSKKVWKDHVLQMDLKSHPEFPSIVDFLRRERPFSPNELAKAKWLDLGI